MQETGSMYADLFGQMQNDLTRRRTERAVYYTIENSVDHPLDFLDRNQQEREVLDLIALGNPTLLGKYIQPDVPRTEPIHPPEFAKETLDREKYMSVIFIALACRAAMEGGLPEHIAYGMSDGCIWAIDHAATPEQITKHRHDAAISFCKAVHDHRLQQLSPPVRKCCDYMALRMHATITLQELSQVCHLSPHYISDLFRKELNMGALQFYHKSKLLYARHLLKNTSSSVSEIAALLAYPSHSNFTQRFKREYGMTPQQYRQMEERHYRL